VPGKGNVTLDVITGYRQEYNFYTGNFSGNVLLHFDLGNNTVCDKSILNVLPNSLYRVTLNVTVDPDRPVTTVIPYDAYGRPGQPYVEYTYRPWEISVSEGGYVLERSDTLITGTISTVTVDAEFVENTGGSVITSVASASLQVYPNPVKESFRIDGLAAPTPVIITDLSGRTVLQQTVSSNETIPAGHWPEGVYIVRVNGQSMKIIKKNY
jgi:hypothetical protein